MNYDIAKGIIDDMEFQEYSYSKKYCKVERKDGNKLGKRKRKQVLMLKRIAAVTTWANTQTTPIFPNRAWAEWTNYVVKCPASTVAVNACI